MGCGDAADVSTVIPIPALGISISVLCTQHLSHYLRPSRPLLSSHRLVQELSLEPFSCRCNRIRIRYLIFVIAQVIDASKLPKSNSR